MSLVDIGRERESRAGDAQNIADGAAVAFRDITHVGPGSLAGRYLRQFWQPVYHDEDLAPGDAKPLRIMAQDYTIYKGESGKAYVIDSRCAHRAMPMNAGWVEGEEIRCLYHGWKYAGDGRCTDQPAEPRPFCDRVRIGGYPTRTYLGLVFAYLGEGEAPEFPRYPSFEAEDVTLNLDTYTRACHFFNNAENAGDFSHLCYAHKGWMGAWDLVDDPVTISAEETDWGIMNKAVRESGKTIVSQIGMPNILHAQGLPDDPEVGFREFIAWWVPIEDDRHTQFTVTKLTLPPEILARYQTRRSESRAKQDLDREQVARDILEGRLRWKDVDPERVSLLFLQDDVAQMGVGLPTDREREHFGKSDACVAVLRRVWLRELGKFARGETLKNWRRTEKEEVLTASY
jgi:5,5'-dehydrodivanillate O-demethylase